MDANVQNMSGLELLQTMQRGELPHPSMADTIPMQVVAVLQGKVTFAAQADERHLNPAGGVHGGFAATVLDSATGCAVHSALAAGVGYGTVDLNVKIVKAVPLNTRLLAEANLLHLSKRLGTAEATLKDEQGRLYAHATATCMILGG
ncbi:PaaI family thioesterase [Halioxenophilus sp. WMMB6]|uniref:PaaI family thioesterase n=1 Tax=Halioxenophilus sp. WMMB6 TaxID=3073815 RepID=UPI00295EF0DE|nr:PaaI family thioesterase [Halioxenophilus sp. WMMB6]